MQKIRGYRICTNRVKKYNVHLRRKEKTKKFFSSLKRFTVIFTIISIAISGVKIYDYFTGSQKFNIKNIIINYNDKEYISSILKENDITIGSNIFKANLRNIGKTLMSNSSLDNVKVKRKLPDTIIVSAENKVPLAYIGERKLYQIDKDCIISLSRNKNNIPVISGYDVVPEEIGKKTNNKNILSAIKFLKDIDGYYKIKKDNRCIKDISLIDISDSNFMELKTSEGTSIIFGEGGFDRKIKRLESLFDDLKTKGKKAISIDLRFRNEAAVRFK